MWNNVFPWSTLVVQKEDVCDDMLILHLLSSVAQVKHMYMIETRSQKTEFAFINKHKCTKQTNKHTNKRRNKLTIRKNRQTNNYQINWPSFSVHFYRNHDWVRRIDCINSFCMHNSGLWVLLKNASQNCKTLRLWLRNKRRSRVNFMTCI